MKTNVLLFKILSFTLVTIAALLLSCSEDTGTNPEPFKGLVAFWSLDEVSGLNVADGSGHNLNGTATGTTIADGIAGKCRSFDGNDYLQVPDNDLLDITNQITIMFWAKTNQTFATTGGIPICKRVEGGYINYAVQFGEVFYPTWPAGGVSSGLVFTYGYTPGGPTNVVYCTHFEFHDNQWHHYAISLQYGVPGSAKIMIDGNEVPGFWMYANGTPGGGTEIPLSNNYPLMLGGQLSTSPGYWIGQLDQIRMYNRNLSQTEIVAIYDQEAPNQPGPTGLVAYWPLDELSGDVVSDVSGNNLTGSANGATITDGVVDNCRSFDGVNDYLEVPHDSLLSITDEITLMMWAKIDPSGHEGILFTKRQCCDACYINYGIKVWATATENYATFIFGSGCATGSHYAITNLPKLSDGNWHHLAISFHFGDPSSAKWVVDGSVINGAWTHWDGTPGGGTEIPPINAEPLHIGNQLSTSHGYFKGQMDQLRIYNQSLSESEITTIYTQERPL